MHNNRLTRRQRRALQTEAGHAVTVLSTVDDALAWHPSSGPAASASPAPPSGRPRRGLIRRARAALVRREVRRVAPALVPVLVAGIVVGIVVGLAIAAFLTLARLDLDEL